MSDFLMELGSVRISYHESLRLTQTIVPLGGWTDKRMFSGALKRSQHWSKLEVLIEGYGWVPPGLGQLDFSAQMLLKCPASRLVTSASNVITVPAARRSDAGFTPTFCALVNGEWQDAALDSVSVNNYTITPVSGATAYGVHYWPELTVLAEFQESNEINTKSANWRVIAREV